MTPREVDQVFAAERARGIDRLREGMWTAFHVVAFQREKRPNLRSAMRRLDAGPRTAQTVEQQIARARQITTIVNA